MKTILEEAAAVCRQRQADYGHPRQDFTRTAALWTAILGAPVTAKQVALCMVALKLSRECFKPKRDNLVDAVGYLQTAKLLETERENK